MTYRLIFSLRFELEPLPGSPPTASRFITVLLDEHGNTTTRNGRPRLKPRTIDLRIGDELMCNGRWSKILAIEADRQNWLNEQEAASRQGDGYLYNETLTAEELRAERPR